MATQMDVLYSLGLAEIENEPALEEVSREEELRAYAEIMQSDRTIHAPSELMLAYADGTIPPDCVPSLLKHLAHCVYCRGDQENLLEIEGVPETNEARRVLRELQLRARQDLAKRSVVIKKGEGEYRVSVHHPDTGVWEERTAQLPDFAHHEPVPGERVLVWVRKDGGAWLLGETWESVRPLDTEERSDLPPLTRQERLEPAYPYKPEQIADLLNHAGSN